MKLRCPSCGSDLEIEHPTDGAKLRCPQCKRRFRLRVHKRQRAGVGGQSNSAHSSVSEEDLRAVTQTGETADLDGAGMESVRAGKQADPNDQQHPPIPTAYKHAPKLGDYLLVSELGRGGMGKVYKAYHVPTGEIRAVKVLIGEAARSRKVRTRFQREAEVAQSINHPHIVRVFGFDRDPVRKVYYMSMEYLEGGSLSALVRERGKLHWTFVLRVAKQVCQALDALHQRGLVHRDIKPSNLLLDANGNVKLADMGLIRYESETDETSQLTATGAVMGTLDYMAPEQIVDPRNTDIRSDLYALGCTLFHLLTGRPPFPEGSAYQKIQRHLSHPLPEIGLLAPDVPSPLVLIVNRLTGKDPAERFQNPAQVIAALEVLERELSGLEKESSGQIEIPEDFRTVLLHAAETSSRDEIRSSRRKDWLWPAAIAGGSLLLLLFIVWALVQFGASRSTQQETPAPSRPQPVGRELPPLPLRQ